MTSIPLLHQRHISLVVISVFLLMLLVSCESSARLESSRLVENALLSVHAGMRLDEATNRLRSSSGFWHQRICGYTVDKRDGLVITHQLFYYGSHERYETDAVFVRATGVPGSEIIEQPARLDPELTADWLFSCHEVP